jgi:hypothetical protein
MHTPNVFGIRGVHFLAITFCGRIFYNYEKSEKKIIQKCEIEYELLVDERR